MMNLGKYHFVVIERKVDEIFFSSGNATTIAEISSSSLPPPSSVDLAKPENVVNTNGSASQSQTAFNAFQTEEIPAKKPNIQENGSQLDSRLTKNAPVSSTVSNHCTATPISPVASDDVQIRVTHSNAGKAIPLKGEISKTHSDYKLTVNFKNYLVQSTFIRKKFFFFPKVQNNLLSTSYGHLGKIHCKQGTTEIWEIFVGYPVVSFNICAKYVVICCADSTLQIIDLKNGAAHLPTMRLFTPAIHCVFVSSIIPPSHYH